jgi:hypothetical protein
MAKRNTENEAAPSSQQVVTDKEKSISYVVVRDGFRVSDREYDTPDDTGAVEEALFWEKVSNKHSWGEKVAVVQYDSKKHRAYTEK